MKFLKTLSQTKNLLRKFIISDLEYFPYSSERQSAFKKAFDTTSYYSRHFNRGHLPSNKKSNKGWSSKLEKSNSKKTIIPSSWRQQGRQHHQNVQRKPKDWSHTAFHVEAKITEGADVQPLEPQMRSSCC